LSKPTQKSRNAFTSFLYNNSLTLAFVFLFLIALLGQLYTGFKEHNDFLEQKGGNAIGMASYLTSGHFIQATFENWESEFLQMSLFIILSIWLRQKGSSESKPIDEEDDVDREPKPSPDAPWPVRKGGLALKIYRHSLSITFIFLFLLSFTLHLYGSWKDYNEEQLLENKPVASLQSFIGMSKFWFEAFQNYQSEFISIAAIIFLTVYLRQHGSAQSKAVDAPNDENE